MTTVVEAAGERTLATLSAVVDSLLGADLARLSQDEVLDAVRGFEVHHIVDRDKGGTTDTDKLALACGYQNKRRSGRTGTPSCSTASHTGSPRVPPGFPHHTSTPSENPDATKSTAAEYSSFRRWSLVGSLGAGPRHPVDRAYHGSQ
jgi:hypothetical protein